MRLHSLTFLACVGALVAATPAAAPSAADALFGAVPADSAADGIHYNGICSDSQGGVTTESTWVLTGVQDPP